jgi:glyoxylase-like metal-dependent hydrolase (beta-lactamase superfamily II)
MHRLTIACALIVLVLIVSPALFAQENSPLDLTGTWRWIHYEDLRERHPGAYPGDYLGIPLNDAARMRADTYDEEWLSSSPLLQCRPRGPGYQALALDPMRIEKEVDPVNRQLIAYRISFQKTPGDRMIWLDGRPRPSQYAQHSWDGFSTGKFKGDTLEVVSTHIKESFVRRNGIPTSFRATVIEDISLEEPYLEWTFTVIDPDYLSEPLVRSATYIRAPNLQIPTYPCQPEDDRQSGEAYRTPHYLPGENPYLTESAFKYRVPIDGVRGGAETLYPDWRSVGLKLKPPDSEYTFKPVYKDESTKIAERADAGPKSPPVYDKAEALHVSGNVYMIGGAGGNVVLSAGGDGVVMVDSGAGAATEKVLGAVRQITQTLRPPELPDSASPFADSWQATHTYAQPAIRMIINTSDTADHIGGNAGITASPMFRPIGGLRIVAHQAVQSRMVDANAAPGAVPTTTYFSDKYTLYRFLNNQAVQLFHLNATTDGDSMVWFRKADVIAAGDVYNSDIYPPIDIARGGSIDGEIDALNKLVDMCATEFMSQGGTMVIPGHGWISDAGDVGYYRDMMMIIRDRVSAMIKKGMTLEQVKAAKPTMDYDPLYGRQTGVTGKFVEAVYKSLKEKL